MYDFLNVTLSPGLLVIDVFTHSEFIDWAIAFWLWMMLINLVLGVLKRIPLL
jgi:hypothetical protein